MHRFSIQEIIDIEQQNDSICSFRNQVIVLTTNVGILRESRELFAIDAFAVGYVLQGYSITEFNNDYWNTVRTIRCACCCWIQTGTTFQSI